MLCAILYVSEGVMKVVGKTPNKLACLGPDFRLYPLTSKQLETHGCIFSTVATDALVPLVASVD